MNRREFIGRVVKGAAGAAVALSLPPAVIAESVAPAMQSFTRGDIFTIAGHFAVNPITGRETDQLQRFVITADIEGESVPIEQISPNFMFDAGDRVIAEPVLLGKYKEAFVQWYDQ